MRHGIAGCLLRFQNLDWSLPGGQDHYFQAIAGISAGAAPSD
jgi:hypothetical protein